MSRLRLKCWSARNPSATIRAHMTEHFSLASAELKGLAPHSHHDHLKLRKQKILDTHAHTREKRDTRAPNNTRIHHIMALLPVYCTLLIF